MCSSSIPFTYPFVTRGRICLFGDAGIVAQPFTGSGVIKEYHNIKEVLQALNSFDTVEDVLQYWGKGQVRIGNRLLALGEQMEQVFIWNSLNLAPADADTTAAWWKAAVTFPSEFSYAVDEEYSTFCCLVRDGSHRLG